MGWSRRCPGAGQCGSATAETAVLLPALVLLVAVLLSVGQAVVAQVRCADAARTAARAAARGDAPTAVVALAATLAPPGARVSVSRSGEQVGVSVRSRVRLVLPGAPAIDVDGRATAMVEPALLEPALLEPALLEPASVEPVGGLP